MEMHHHRVLLQMLQHTEEEIVPEAELQPVSTLPELAGTIRHPTTAASTAAKAHWLPLGGRAQLCRAVSTKASESLSK